MDRKQHEEEQKLVDEAAWVLDQMLKPTFLFRMARGRLHTLYRDTPDHQERSARTRLVNASREIVKIRDRWNHRVLNNSNAWSAMHQALREAVNLEDAQINELNDKIVARLRANGYRITKREPWD